MILDVELERGLLFLVLENLGKLPAHNVRVRFDKPLHGVGGDAFRDFPYLEVPEDA